MARLRARGATLAAFVAVLLSGVPFSARAAEVPDEPVYPEGETSLTLDRVPVEGSGPVDGGPRELHLRLTPEDGSFTMGDRYGDLRAAFDASGESWSMVFEPPEGEELQVGPYRGATRHPFQSPTHPGLDVTGRGGGCNESLGEFEILELVTDGHGRVVRFAADFRQQCFETDPMLLGTYRFHASPAFPPFPDRDLDGLPDTVDLCPGTFDPLQVDLDQDGVGDWCDAAVEEQVVRMSDDPNGFATGNRVWETHAVDGTFTASASDSFAVLTVKTEAGYGQRFGFGAGKGRRLVRGPYEGADGSYPSSSPPKPKIEHRYCTTATGRFDVLALERNPDGSVRRLAVDFEETCSDGYTMYGQIRFGTPLVPVFLPPPDSDLDGTPDSMDSCVTVLNPLQLDVDRDGVGDACDPTTEETALRFTRGEDLNEWGPWDETLYRTDTAFQMEHGYWIDPEEVWLETDDGTTTWRIRFSPAAGEQLAVGRHETHSNRVLGPGQVRTYVDKFTTDWGQAGYSCWFDYDEVGVVDILEVERGEDGEIVRFAADLVAQCNRRAPTLHLSIRFNSTITLDHDPLPDADDDLIPDLDDLCPLIPDPLQLDLDGDGVGDLCDAPPEEPELPVAPLLSRIAGSDRVATAIEASRDLFTAAGTSGHAGAVVLARADHFADALSGAPLAVDRAAPLLLNPSAALDPRVLAEVRRTLPAGGTVHLLGGTGALSPAVAHALTAAGYRVERHAGADRFATATAVAEELGAPAAVLLVTGRDFPDGLAAGAAAAHLGGVVLLTDGTSLPPATARYLAAHPGVPRIAVGGPAAQADPLAQRIVGTDRYGTARLVAGTLFPESVPAAGLASGQGFADALSGSAHVVHLGGPLLLSRPEALPATTAQYLRTHVRDRVVLYGGPAALSPLLDPLG